MDREDLTGFCDRVRRGTLSTLDKFEKDELGWAPVGGGYSLREICLHIAHEEVIEISYGLSRDTPSLPDAFRPGDYVSKSSIRDLWSGVRARTMAFVNSLDDDALGTPVELAWGETQRPLDVLLHVVEHEIHHRGELSLALGLLGREGLDV
jgi:uncharacterized damage-inducible protein DinB